jgi:uncharacterized membrane protein YfcA
MRVKKSAVMSFIVIASSLFVTAQCMRHFGVFSQYGLLYLLMILLLGAYISFFVVNNADAEGAKKQLHLSSLMLLQALTFVLFRR